MTAGAGAAGSTDILVTGASGFIGAAVMRELVAQGQGSRIRVLARRRIPEWMTDAGVVTWQGDLTDPAGLKGLCTGVSTVVHLARQVGGDEESCTAVNEDGTRNMLAEARRAGTARVLYLSTCGVYRDGDHRGASESALVTDPTSVASRTRLAGERLVLASGGIVLRPHLVYGAGDRHVVPNVVRWLNAVPAWVVGASARTSMVAVTDLAAAIAALVVKPDAGRSGDVFHVADPRPMRVLKLITAVCDLLNLPMPAMDLPLDEHRARTRAAMPALTDHQYSLLTRDHWYESSRIWGLTGVSPGPGFSARFAEVADWYRDALGIRRPMV